ncbi:transposase [Bradyrhizobium sp. Cham227]|nr:transposase [Bradyrhizobium brasilense]
MTAGADHPRSRRPTDAPLHGHQEGRFFHGYYDCYCHLSLYVFCCRHLLAAKLRHLRYRRQRGQRRGGRADCSANPARR